MLPVAVVTVLAGALVPAAFLVNEGLIFAVPVFLAFAAILSGPFWKRRQRERIANRPRWELHPE